VKPGFEAWFHVAGLTLHVVLSLWLLPILGLPATVIALLAGNLAGAAMFLALVGRELRWSMREVLVGPHVIPALAAVSGGLIGYVLDRAIPTGTGPLRWGLLGIVVCVSAAVALATTLVTRYIALDDVRAIFAGRSNPMAPGNGVRGE
jgi:peptidoglycan biosynthesis protein MviN/MurJ (putative lipid II flippase)